MVLLTRFYQPQRCQAPAARPLRRYLPYDEDFARCHVFDDDMIEAINAALAAHRPPEPVPGTSCGGTSCGVAMYSDLASREAGGVIELAERPVGGAAIGGGGLTASAMLGEDDEDAGPIGTLN